MLSLLRIILCLSFFIMCSCAESLDEFSEEVSGYVELLVKEDEPTIAEIAQVIDAYHCESATETYELHFLLKECQSRGWGFYSQACINFTQEACDMEKPSHEISWIREQFSTAGKSYQFIDIQSQPDSQSYFIAVKIGENDFLFWHGPGPIPVKLSKVNGRNFYDYLDAYLNIDEHALQKQADNYFKKQEPHIEE